MFYHRLSNILELYLYYFTELDYYKYILLVFPTMVLNWNTLKNYTAFIYDIIISMFFTITAHLIMTQYMTSLTGAFLDVGCGTGAALKSILPKLNRTYNRIVGVDLDRKYTDKAR